MQQQLAQAHGQLALGPHNRLGGLELIGLGEELQALFGRLGPPQLVGVQELFPAPFAGRDQGLGRGKGQDELPREGPVQSSKASSAAG